MNTQKGPFFPCFAGDQMREYGPIKLQHKRGREIIVYKERKLAANAKEVPVRIQNLSR